jgi:hypothetical protein
VGEGEEEEGGVDDGRRGSEGVVIMEVTWFQVDLDYEFDAPRWFDLAQEEAPLDAAAAQEWFTSAPSYPPSRACSPLPRLAISSSSFVSSRASDDDSGSYVNGGRPVRVRSTIAFQMGCSSTPPPICVSVGLVGGFDAFRKRAISRGFFFVLLSISRFVQHVNDRYGVVMGDVFKGRMDRHAPFWSSVEFAPMLSSLTVRNFVRG